MRILVINNDGAGFANHVEIEPRLTIAQLFSRQSPGASEYDYLIRVNRQSAAQDQQLVERDRVSITPRKIEGAGEPLVKGGRPGLACFLEAACDSLSVVTEPIELKCV